MDEKGVILLTGYEAFGEFEVNPSIAACNRRACAIADKFGLA